MMLVSQFCFADIRENPIFLVPVTLEQLIRSSFSLGIPWRNDDMMGDDAIC